MLYNIVGKDEKVRAAQVVSGRPLLPAAALKAARQAVFAPALLEGRPVNVSGVITYNFALSRRRDGGNLNSAVAHLNSSEIQMTGKRQMKYFPVRLLSLALLVVCVAAVQAQAFQVERTNARPAANSAEVFTSLDARFSVDLPRKISGLSPITFDTPQGRITAGETYLWQLDGAQFEIGYLDLQKSPESPEVARAALRKFADEIAAGVAAQQGGKTTSRTDISLGSHIGHEMRIELPQSHVVSRLYAAGGRIYRLAAISTRKDAPQFQETATGTLNSFRILSLGEVMAERARRIAAATPSPLPQEEPAARKLKSDAEDEGLKGKVKTLFVEMQDLSGTWSVQRRRPSQLISYNERGHVTQKAGYDSKGNLFQIRAYGYIDGERASNDKIIRNDYDSPPVPIAVPAGDSKPTHDPRYSFKYKHRYDGQGRLVEESSHGSNGKLWLRYVYNYKGAGERETLVYSQNGSLNQKYLERLDAQGNTVEQSYFNTKTDTVDNKYAYAYEFDRHGNWIKQTTSKWTTKEGKPQFLPHYITYRTITYY